MQKKQTGGKVATTKKQQYKGLNDQSYDQMHFPVLDNPVRQFRGLDNSQPVAIIDQLGRQQVLHGPQDTMQTYGPVYEQRQSWAPSWGQQMQTGGRAPLYVTDPHDPRLQAYADSLDAYNTTKAIYDRAQSTGILDVSSKKNKTSGKANTADTINPKKTTTEPYSKYKGDPGFDYAWYNHGTEHEMYPETINSYINTRWYDPRKDWSVNYANPKQDVIYQPQQPQPSIPQPKSEPKPKPRVKQQLQSVPIELHQFPTNRQEPQPEQIDINSLNPNPEEWLSPQTTPFSPAGFYKQSIIPGGEPVPSRKNGGAVTKQWLKKYIDGGNANSRQNPPIYVTDPHSKQLQSYRDSLNLAVNSRLAEKQYLDQFANSRVDNQTGSSEIPSLSQLWQGAKDSYNPVMDIIKNGLPKSTTSDRQVVNLFPNVATGRDHVLGVARDSNGKINRTVLPGKYIPNSVANEHNLADYIDDDTKDINQKDFESTISKNGDISQISITPGRRYIHKNGWLHNIDDPYEGNSNEDGSKPKLTDVYAPSYNIYRDPNINPQRIEDFNYDTGAPGAGSNHNAARNRGVVQDPKANDYDANEMYNVHFPIYEYPHNPVYLKDAPIPKPRPKTQMQQVQMSQPSFPRTTGEPQPEQININDWNPNEEYWSTPVTTPFRPAGFYKKGMFPGQDYVPSRKNGGWLSKYQTGGWADPNRLATVNNPVRGISAGTTTANVPGQKMSQKQVDVLLKYTQKRADDAQVQADIQRTQDNIMSQHMGPAPVYTPYEQEEHAQRLHEINRDAGRDDQGNPRGFTKWALENNKGQRADEFIQKIIDAGTAAEGAEGIVKGIGSVGKTAGNWLKNYGAATEEARPFVDNITHTDLYPQQGRYSPKTIITDPSITAYGEPQSIFPLTKGEIPYARYAEDPNYKYIPPATGDMAATLHHLPELPQLTKEQQILQSHGLDVNKTKIPDIDPYTGYEMYKPGGEKFDPTVNNPWSDANIDKAASRLGQRNQLGMFVTPNHFSDFNQGEIFEKGYNLRNGSTQHLLNREHAPWTDAGIDRSPEHLKYDYPNQYTDFGPHPPIRNTEDIVRRYMNPNKFPDQLLPTVRQQNKYGGKTKGWLNKY